MDYSTSYAVTKCPSNQLSLTNCVIVNPTDYEKFRYVVLKII